MIQNVPVHSKNKRTIKEKNTQHGFNIELQRERGGEGGGYETKEGVHMGSLEELHGKNDSDYLSDKLAFFS